MASRNSPLLLENHQRNVTVDLELIELLFIHDLLLLVS